MPSPVANGINVVKVVRVKIGVSGPLADSARIAADPPRRDAVAEEAERRLQTCAGIDAQFVSCEHHEGVLVLRGQVSSYYQKQLAQESVRRLPGVETILNTLRVGSPNRSEQPDDR